MGEEERGGEQRLLEALVAALAGVAAEREPPVPNIPPTVARLYEGTFLDLPGTGAALKVLSLPTTPDVYAQRLFGAPAVQHTWVLGIATSMRVMPDLLVGAARSIGGNFGEGVEVGGAKLCVDGAPASTSDRAQRGRARRA